MRKLLALAALLGAVSFACSAPRSDEAAESSESPVVSHAQLDGTSLERKQLALTFDDGPGPRTLELGTYLADRGIRATFFMVGNNVTDDRRAVLAALRDQGHLVANHTFDHQSLPDLGDGDVVAEVQGTHDRIAPYVDQGHFLLRAPYGAWNARVADAINASAYTTYVGSVFWDIGGELSNGYGADWDCWGKGLTVDDCASRYRSEIDDKGRGIVLMHDVHSQTIDMVKAMVPSLEAAGYSFVRVDDVPDVASALRGGSGVTPAPVSKGDCGGLGYEGRCDGATVTWCEDDVLKSKDCGAAGKTCAIDPARPAIGYTCVAPAAAPSPAPAKGCNGLGYDGVCEGSVLFWCENEELRTKDCSSKGQRCGRDANPDIGLNCIP